MKYDDEPDLPSVKIQKTRSRFEEASDQERGPTVSRTRIPVIVTGLCAAGLTLLLVHVWQDHPVFGQPDLVKQGWDTKPLTHIDVTVEPRTMDGRRRMPTWSELFEQYRLGDSVRTASLAWYNARRTQAEPLATPDSEIPEGAHVVVVLGEDN